MNGSGFNGSIDNPGGHDGIDALRESLNAYGRVGLAILPTPLQRLDRLSTFLKGPTLWIKRDDLTGLGMGGNKLRKLDYLLKEAVDTGCDTVVSGGVVQSNSQRQVAAAASKLGLECHLAVFHVHLNGAANGAHSANAVN